MRDAIRRTPMLELLGGLLTAAELRAWLDDSEVAPVVAALPADADIASMVVALNENGGVPAALVDRLVARFPEHEIAIIEACADAPPPIRLDAIGLALSGRGVGAAAYHLGALDLLDALGLRQRVRRLSTVGGGTLLGVGYARRADDSDYAAFADAAMTFLAGHDPLGGALREVRAGAGSLAAAVSRSIARSDFVADATLAELRLEPGKLEQVSFNLSDLRVGLPFRFVRGADGQRRLGGSRAFPVPDATLGAVRLADVAAASTCTAGGFGPMVFPDAFVGVDAAGTPGVPLVDGALLDNDAVAGLRLGNQTGADPDLVLACDGSSAAPTAPRAPGLVGPPLPIGLLVAAAVAAWAWGMWVEIDSTTMPGPLGRIHTGLALALLLAGVGAVGWAVRRVGGLRARLPRGGTLVALRTVLGAPLGRVLRHRRARAEACASVEALVSTSRVRRALLDDLFQQRGVVVYASRSALSGPGDAADGVVPRGDAPGEPQPAAEVPGDGAVADASAPPASTGGAAAHTPVAPPSALLHTLAAAADGSPAERAFADPLDAMRSRATGRAAVCYQLLVFLERNRWSATRESEALRARLDAEWVRILRCTDAEQIVRG